MRIAEYTDMHVIYSLCYRPARLLHSVNTSAFPSCAPSLLTMLSELYSLNCQEY